MPRLRKHLRESWYHFRFYFSLSVMRTIGDILKHLVMVDFHIRDVNNSSILHTLNS